MDPAGILVPEQSFPRTRRLWSLWDMLTLNAADFMRLLQIFFKSEADVGVTRGPLPSHMEGANQAAAAAIRGTCDALHLPITRASTEYIIQSKTSEELSAAFLHVKRNMHHELLSRLFFEPDPRFKSYFENQKLFGDAVFMAFPSANDDIFEAGSCLALERATACVMHLMRVLEVGLATLANAVGIAKQNDWGKYLKEINAELDRRSKTAGARSAEEQFYAEAAFNFDQLRRAFRNPTMHPDKSYSQDRAEEILLAAKSFMNHLATQIFEF